MDELSETDAPSIKIVLLGDSGVGKTTCLTRWMTGKFYQNLKQTVGTNHQRKIVELREGKVDLFIWDTAGQEQFRSLMPMYARNSCAVIVVAAIDDPASFTHIKDWINTALASIESETPFILAVNKIDKCDENPYQTDKIEREFSSQFKAIFYISASTGENVDSMFLQAANVGYDFFKTKQEGDDGGVKTIESTPNEEKKKCC